MTDYFGLDDLLDQDHGGRVAARWVAGALGVVFFLLSALTTASFFHTYAPGLGHLAGPVVGPWVSAVIGVLCLDGAALAWGYVRARGCTSRQQQVLTAAVGAADLVGGLVVSGLYVLLSGSALDAGVVDAGGALTDFGRGLHLLGTGLVTAALVVNFAATWLMSALSADTRAAARSTELAAVVREGSHRVETMRAQQVVSRTLQDIARDLPTAAAAVADDNRRRYIAATMSRGDHGGDDLDQLVAPAAPVASVNGHGAGVNPTGRPTR